MLLLLKKQRKYNDLFVHNFLRSFSNQFNTNLHKSTEKKIHTYYALAVPLLNYTLSILQRGKGLTEKETQKSVLAGILTPIYDDLLDLDLIDTARQKELLLYPENYIPIILEDTIARKCLTEIDKLGIFYPAKFHKIKEEIYNSQIASLRQFNPDTSLEELRQIMNQKSGCSHVFYYYLLDVVPDKSVENSIKLFGQLGQLSNDCFDVYKDYQEGIKTIPNTCEDFEVLEQEFTDGILHFCRYTRSLGFPKAQTELYLRILVLILSTGVVVTRKFIILQKKIGKGPLPFGSLPRKTFIGDMEKPINMLRVISTAAHLLAK